MDGMRTVLDLSQLLDFSQGKPGWDVLRNAAKVGSKFCYGINKQVAEARE